MFARAFILFAALAVVTRPLAADPDVAHKCQVAPPLETAGHVSAGICTPLEAETLRGPSAIYLSQGPGAGADIGGGRNDHARDLARLASYAAAGNQTEVEIFSRQLSNFGVSDEELNGAIAQMGPRNHPSAAVQPHSPPPGLFWRAFSAAGSPSGS
jgi:hypothetical protein